MSDIKSENAFTFPAVDESNHRYLLVVKDFNNRAVACRQQNDFKGAIENYNNALRIDRGFAVLYNNRGVAWLKKKEFDQAISDFSNALKIEPDLGVALFNRGNAWRAKKIWIALLPISHERLKQRLTSPEPITIAEKPIVKKMRRILPSKISPAPSRSILILLQLITTGAKPGIKKET